MNSLCIKSVLILLLVGLLSGCAQQIILTQDITKVDFVLQNLSATQINVNGVVIGDSLQQVNEILGTPHSIDDFESIVNYHYFDGENETFLVNFENGNVRRITVFAPFDKYLIGESKLTRDKAQVYATFGVADEYIDQGRTRRFIYNERGLEVFIRAGQQSGYSFFAPQEAKNHKII